MNPYEHRLMKMTGPEYLELAGTPMPQSALREWIAIFRLITGGPSRTLRQEWQPTGQAFGHIEPDNIWRDPEPDGTHIRLVDTQQLMLRIYPRWQPRPGYRRALINWLAHEATVLKIGLLPEMTVAQAEAFAEDPFCEDAYDALVSYPELA